MSKLAQDWSPSPGYIIRAEVQYSDKEGNKSRFPVVVSSSDFNRQHTEVIVAFTTSSRNIRRPQSYDVEISDRHTGFSQTGLAHSTTVRCGRLWTIDKRKISDVIGTVPDNLLLDIQKLVFRCFTVPTKTNPPQPDK